MSLNPLFDNLFIFFTGTGFIFGIFPPVFIIVLGFAVLEFEAV